jgi:transcriptional regulator with XRE-family HTH domain
MLLQITILIKMKNSDLEDIVFGRVLRKLRQATDKTQEGLALDAGLNRNFISLIELGQRRPTLKTLIQLSRGLSMPISVVMQHFENELRESVSRDIPA